MLKIVIINIIRYTLGYIMIWPAIYFREYARNIYYSYNLCTKCYGKEHVGRVDKPNGYVNCRYVSYYKYIFVKVLLWIWLDDSLTSDTYDTYKLRKISNSPNIPFWFLRMLMKAIKAEDITPIKGSVSELLDKRKEYPLFSFIGVIITIWDNPASNLKI